MRPTQLMVLVIVDLSIAVTTPTITPAPTGTPLVLEARAPVDSPDAVSLAQVLLTAVPESLRQIAATNLPAASQILWSEFLDDNKPAWFTALPTDIQGYLVQKFGPKTASASVTERPSVAASDSSGSPSITSSPESTVPSDTTKFVTSIVTISDSSLPIPVAKPTKSSAVSAPPTSDPQNSGLSTNAKIGLGVGIPLAILGLAAFALACCFLVRRRRRRRRRKARSVSTGPPSADFIPQSAFHEKSLWDGLDQHQPRQGSAAYPMLDPYSPQLNRHVFEEVDTSYSPPTIAPPVLHTHTSKRGRGKRTSYTSLQSVPEASETEERNSEPSPLATTTPPRTWTLGVIPPGPAASKVKRKPVSGQFYPNAQEQGGDMGVRKLLSQSLLYHELESPTHGSYPGPSENGNPFNNQYSYMEDYGPEYSNGYESDSVAPKDRQETGA
ncbi:hypothetical protein GQ43DRAFT_473493 [Delitschia confertaspora ATCC 74209]|uniref:Transmembrane protein n=1 Tax=Delitschia confertaspora ATCC 74209 TaxID=1513339 RepID=A0A9P4JHP0_9PLEO|nr:hypothetical protein GQ43DRAFT_473493 [Delitschia confertaspora ATCC 74209]